jgi:spore maturation protein CgeD
MPKVSVILTTYNRPVFLKRAIDSVLEQTLTDFELLVMDDDSTDKKQQKLLQSYWNTPGVFIYKSSVPAKTRTDIVRYAHMVNIGLMLATGDYVCYLCDDDFFFPDRLKKMTAYLDKHPKKHVVFGKQIKYDLMPDGSLKVKGKRFPNMVLERASYWVDHSSVLHRRELVDKVGYWDTDALYWSSADAVYWSKLNKAGYKFYPLNSITDGHIFHNKSMTVKNNWSKLT